MTGSSLAEAADVAAADYLISHGDGCIRAGKGLLPGAVAGTRDLRGFLSDIDPMLRAVVHSIKGAQVGRILLDGLRAVLATQGRETSLPLSAAADDHGLRGDLARQAASIGAALADMAAVVLAESCRLGDAHLKSMSIRSNCDGHVWTPDVVGLLLGPRGGPRVMQIYNEWLHQMVLLRDYLLPFANWQDVPVPPPGRPLRNLEAPRKRFLADLLLGKVRHEAMVDYAAAAWGGTGGAVAYGFQASGGFALPAVFGEGGAPALLTWHRARLVPGYLVPFHYADPGYYEQPSRPAGPGVPLRPPRSCAGNAFLQVEKGQNGVRLTLRLSLDGQPVTMDAGRVARGARYAVPPGRANPEDPRAGVAVSWHPAHTLLSGDAYVTADAGVHACPADPVTSLALLGAIYPENVLLARGGSIDTLRRGGKGFGPLFLIGDLA